MSRLVKGVLAASLLLGAWPAAAATGAKSRPAPVISGLSGVSAPNVRLAALVGPTGTVIRGKGIASVNHEFTGAYCVLPSSSLSIDVTSVVPAITADFAL